MLFSLGSANVIGKDPAQLRMTVKVPKHTTEPHNLRCWAEIDLTAIEDNVRAIRRAIPPHMRYISVLKANGYGHGLAPLATHLLQGGVDDFAVATLDEADTLRQLGRGWRILLLGALLPGEATRAAQLDVVITLSDRDEIERIDHELVRAKATLSAHLKIDTGMGRLGVWYDNLQATLNTIGRARRIKLEGTYTHYANAPADPEFTHSQRLRFTAALPSVIERCRPNPLIHADNSGGVETCDSASPFNAARVGLLQFGVPQTGLNPSVQVRPVLSLHARISLVKVIPAGETVSYGRTRKLTTDTPVAIITAGYADGIPIALSNRGRVLIDGRPCPIIGRVTMDQTIVDLSSHPDPLPVPGSVATFIGTSGKIHIGVDEFAADAGTIPWESLCGISSRVRRIYHHPRQ